MCAALQPCSCCLLSYRQRPCPCAYVDARVLRRLGCVCLVSSWVVWSAACWPASSVTT